MNCKKNASSNPGEEKQPQLMESIERYGIMNPLIVMPTREGVYHIIYVKSFLIRKDYSGCIESGTSTGKQILSRSTDFRTSDAIKCISRGSGTGNL